jgi:hypothetical protein
MLRATQPLTPGLGAIRSAARLASGTVVERSRCCRPRRKAAGFAAFLPRHTEGGFGCILLCCGFRSLSLVSGLQFVAAQALVVKGVGAGWSCRPCGEMLRISQQNKNSHRCTS